MQRDMSYDLDDAMALRDAGEVQSLSTPKTMVLRTPGLTAVFPNEVHDAADMEADTTHRPMDLAGVTVDLPVLGQVNLLHIGLAAGLVYLLCRMRKH